MGIDIPGEFPELDDTKWYKVTWDYWFNTESADRCGDVYEGNCTNCREGFYIREWLEAGKTCKWVFWECFFLTKRAHRIIDIQGPFDTEQNCLDDL